MAGTPALRPTAKRFSPILRRLNRFGTSAPFMTITAWSLPWFVLYAITAFISP